MIRIASILLVLAALAAAGLQAARSLRPTNAMRVVGTAVTDSRAAARPVAAGLMPLGPAGGRGTGHGRTPPGGGTYPIILWPE